MWSSQSTVAICFQSSYLSTSYEILFSSRLTHYYSQVPSRRRNITLFQPHQPELNDTPNPVSKITNKEFPAEAHIPSFKALEKLLPNPTTATAVKGSVKQESKTQATGV